MLKELKMKEEQPLDRFDFRCDISGSLVREILQIILVHVKKPYSYMTHIRFMYYSNIQKKLKS